MICRFCKENFKGKEVKINSTEESVECCSECFDDILDLMESGAMEEKLFKSPTATLSLDAGGRALVERLPNGKIRHFNNAKIHNIERIKEAPDYNDIRIMGVNGLQDYQRDFVRQHYCDLISLKIELDFVIVTSETEKRTNKELIEMKTMILYLFDEKL